MSYPLAVFASGQFPTLVHVNSSNYDVYPSLQNINSLFLQYTFKQPQIYPAWPWPLPCPLIAFFTANERI